jgi:FMN phosphatase YigB (HAD superfamily)
LRVAATGLGEFLDDVVVAADVGHFKPEPELLWAAAERLGVDPERCVYIGDSVAFDVAAARAAGMVAMLVSPDPPDPTATVRPDLWVPNLAHLITRSASHCRRWEAVDGT